MKRHKRSSESKPPRCPILVRPRPGQHARGHVRLGPWRAPCALGSGGPVGRKREGDGGTPVGRFRLCRVLYRRDRVRRPRTGLPVAAIAPRDGWCDDDRDRNYNRPVRLPYAGRAERLWRDDALYDLVVVLDYNRRPRGKGRGSAIFMHVARDGLAPTEGCVALARADLERLLALCVPGSAIVIGP